MDAGGKRVFICLSLGIFVLLLLVSFLFLFQSRGAPEKRREAGREDLRRSAGLSSASAPRSQPVAPPRLALRALKKKPRAAPQNVASPLQEAPAPPPALPSATSGIRGSVLQMRGNPVARATVTLWEHYAGEPDEGDRALLARGNTDWEGNFTFNGVRSSEGAWIEVKALYYLGFQGPSFRIAPGEALEIATVTLHFGGSMQGEVFGEAGRKVPHANVRLIPGFTHRGAAAATRTDSKGTFLFSGLEPGDYTLEVLVDGEVAASVDGLWVQADAPTLKVHVHLDRNSLTFPEDQDLQQFRVYRAERIISRGSRRFGSLEGIQEYVDGMMASSWWESGFREVGAIQVRMGEDEDPARGGVDSVEEETGERESRVSGHIELPRWGWDELTALHEVAHVLSQEGDHGRLFARDFFFLVSVMLGAAAASELSLAYAAEGVLW